MKVEEELRFLQLIDNDEKEAWHLNFWKLTDETEQEFERIVKGCKGSDIDQIFPDDFYNEMMRQIKYFNEHGIRIDGTIPWLVEHFGSVEKTMEWAINA